MMQSAWGEGPSRQIRKGVGNNKNNWRRHIRNQLRIGIKASGSFRNLDVQTFTENYMCWDQYQYDRYIVGFIRGKTPEEMPAEMPF